MGKTSMPGVSGAGLDLLRSELDRRLSTISLERDAVLIHLPLVPHSADDREMYRNRGGLAWPPQGLLYISAAFRSLGIRTRIVDLNFAALREIQRERPHVELIWKRVLDEAMVAFPNPLACVSYMFDVAYLRLKEVCGHIRLKHPASPILAGGVAATADPERLLREGLADLVLLHEGEQTLERLYAYARGQTAEMPVNVCFINPSDSVVRTPVERGGDVDTDIREEYEGIPIAEYGSVGSLSNYSRMKGIDRRFAVISSRRGCRGRCTYCSVPGFHGRGVRMRKIDGVIAEMEHLHRRYGIRHFGWTDDDLLFDARTAREMFQKIATVLPGITWEAPNGLIAGSVTREMMQVMRRSGCVAFNVGLESGDEAMLKRLKKPVTLHAFESFAAAARECPEIFTAVNVILGFPGELFAQMLNSLRAVARAGLDWCYLYIYMPLRNTELNREYGGGSGISADPLPAFSLTRTGAFDDYRMEGGIMYGYDVFDIDPASVPGRDQLIEIWFVFNYLVNFLRMPALFSGSGARLIKGIRWLEALSGIGRENPVIDCALYYLRCRAADTPRTALEALKDRARTKFKQSDYWRFRDRQFCFSALLDGAVPPIDPRCGAFFPPSTS